MKLTSARGRLLASSMICGVAALFGSAAMAQDTPAATTEVEGLVITGSRIPQPNLTSVSPVQVTTSEEFRLQEAPMGPLDAEGKPFADARGLFEPA